MERNLKNTKDTEKMAWDVLEILSEVVEKTNQATLVTLSGELGAGKTTFVKALAEKLCVSEDVTSPTFVIERRYKTKHKIFSKLVHIDCYRLENGKELQNLEWIDRLSEPGSLIALEWPEKVREVIPENVIEIEFQVGEGDQRVVNIKGLK